jgi:hypothetical protein
VPSPQPRRGCLAMQEAPEGLQGLTASLRLPRALSRLPNAKTPSGLRVLTGALWSVAKPLIRLLSFTVPRSMARPCLPQSGGPPHEITGPGSRRSTKHFAGAAPAGPWSRPKAADHPVGALGSAKIEGA